MHCMFIPNFEYTCMLGISLIRTGKHIQMIMYNLYTIVPALCVDLSHFLNAVHGTTTHTDLASSVP